MKEAVEELKKAVLEGLEKEGLVVVSKKEIDSLKKQLSVVQKVSDNFVDSFDSALDFEISKGKRLLTEALVHAPVKASKRPRKKRGEKRELTREERNARAKEYYHKSKARKAGEKESQKKGKLSDEEKKERQREYQRNYQVKKRKLSLEEQLQEGIERPARERD